METIGNRLKTERKKQKLTQTEISSMLKITQATYNGYERDKHLPDIITLCKLADILKTSTDYLLGRYTKQ